MFESLKKLFSKPASPPPQSPARSLSASISSAPPAPFPSRATPGPAPASAAAPVPLQTGDVVQLPLNDILAHLPATVAPLLLARPGGTFAFPVRSALEQLGTGAVRVRFAQLRQSVLPGTFANDSSQDDTFIDLPLPQILAAIGPAAFSRRSQQRVTDIPEDVTGVFGPKGASPTTISPSAPIAAATTAPLAPPPPAPAPPSKPTSSIKPASPAPALKPPTSAPLPFAAPKAASPLPFSTRPAPPAPVPSTPELPKPAPPSGDERTLVTSIGAICQSWPETIRQEIEQSNLAGASVFIPMSRLESGMKTGRVVFAWSDLISWLSAPLPAQSSQGDAELELPLSVIAPLFIGKHRAASPQRKVNIGQNIPDLFAGLAKSPAPAPAPPATAPAPSPAVAAPVAAAPSAAAAPQQNALGELFGQPSKEEWTLQEITLRIAALPGVSGSLLATADGLLVAGQVPSPLKTETLAAFLPQIFGRMSSCSEEVKLGALRAVTVSTDSAPCAIFKAGPLYLAVLGKPGQSLPEPMLLRIADQLAKQNQ
jgi:predicted regulator of Ras-like GTPase activity (Roadblock/LC7/MglB family)